jgi:hypothetical protein
MSDWAWQESEEAFARAEREWRANPKTYEQACLEATRELYAALREVRRADGMLLNELRLEGEYPKTQIVVTWRDERFGGAERERRFSLWPQERLAAPETVASGIEIEVQES